MDELKVTEATWRYLLLFYGRAVNEWLRYPYEEESRSDYLTRYYNCHYAWMDLWEDVNLRVCRDDNK